MCTGSIHTHRILIIDSCPIFRAILQDTFKDKFPHNGVWEAGDGATALHALEENEPELVFIDMGLRDVSGLRLTKTIKSMRPNIFVVLVTAHDTPEYRAAAFEHGANDLLSKDCSIAVEIESIVEAAFAAEKPPPNDPGPQGPVCTT